MVICGFNLSHGGGVSVIADDELVFSSTVADLLGGTHHGLIGRLDRLAAALECGGIKLDDVDEWSIDGWFAPEEGGFAALVDHGDRNVVGAVGRYMSTELQAGFTAPFAEGFARTRSYFSAPHVAGLVWAAVHLSPFPRAAAPQVLVWDDGTPPMLFDLGPEGGAFAGRLHNVMGSVFYTLPRSTDALSPETMLGCGWRELAGPDRVAYRLDIRSIAADFAARAEPDPVLVDAVRQVIESAPADWRPDASRAMVGMIDVAGGLAGPSEVVLRSAFEAIADTTVRRLRHLIDDASPRPLLLTGAVAEDERIVAAVRQAIGDARVWVAPAPGETGYSLGAAVARWRSMPGAGRSLRWRSDIGGPVTTATNRLSWTQTEAPVELAVERAHDRRSPFAFMSGRQELGSVSPRRAIVLTRPSIDDLASVNVATGRPRDARPRWLRLESSGSPANRSTAELTPSWAAVAHELPPMLRALGHGREALVQSVADDGSVVARMIAACARIGGVSMVAMLRAAPPGGSVLRGADDAIEWGGCDVVWADGWLFERLPDGAHR